MIKEPKIECMDDLTESLANNYNKLCSGQIAEGRAKEISNISGKIINSAKCQLEYNSYMKYKHKVKFLEPKQKKD